MDSIRAAQRTPALLVALAIGACALASCTGGISLSNQSGTAAMPAQPSAPPVNMAGRWLLMSPGRGQCNMTFGAAPGAAEGTIAPEGGCPGQFYTSRKWTFNSAGLVIRNHNSQPLAQLSAADGRFAGQSTAGEAITLAR